MSKLYLDVTRLLNWHGNYTGMERFAFEVTKYLVEQADTEVRLCCFAPSGEFVELEAAFNLDDTRLTSPLFGPSPSLRELVKQDKTAAMYQYGKRRLRERKQQQLSKLQTTAQDTLVIYDGLWDRPEYIAAIEQQTAKGVRLAHFVCDVVPLVMPQVCFDFVTAAFDVYFNRIAPQIDILFSISKHTQSDFVKIFGSVLKPTIQKKVVRFGDNFSAALTPAKPALGIDAHEYLLAVGTVEVRKNYQLLYQTYRLALEKKVKLPKLVIVGREGWMSDATIYAIKNDPLVKDSIMFAGPVNDAELQWLYANCLFSVFPSLYEGWGLPVAESLNYGKVCAASESSSIPEIGGDLNCYFSPYSSEACLATITKLVDSSFRTKLEKKLAETYKPTSWSDSGKQILYVLEAQS